MSWQERCREAGGIPTVFPYQFGDRAGAPACRFQTSDGSLDYQPGDLTVFERIELTTERGRDKLAQVAGELVEARDAALEVGLIGLGSRLLGVPKPVVLIGLGAIALIALRPTLDALTGVIRAGKE